MTVFLGPLAHVALLLGLPPALTLGLYRLWSPRFEESPLEAARARWRVLSASLRVEFFLAYSFLLLGPQYQLFTDSVEKIGRSATAALFSLAPIGCYLLGSFARAAVDVRSRRIAGSIGAHWKTHGLLLGLRMGLYILVIPAFFLPFYDLGASPWSTTNLLGFTVLSLLFFIYVLRGMNVVFRLFGSIEPLADRELRDDMLGFAARRHISLTDVGVLRTEAGSLANAFAHFGSNRVVVTDRLRQVLSRDELRSVLLHEIGHLGQLATNLTRLFSSYVAFLVYLYLRPLIEAATRRQVGIGFITLFFGGFLALLVVFRIVFGRFVQDAEAKADVFAVEEGGSEDVYLEALRKIHEANMLPWAGPSDEPPRRARDQVSSRVRPLDGSEGEGWV
ncbi:MAG: M48 family metalloprotease [Planctomycetes bacterium]|nr:M48 family metalloprotease [Planctomycetota bacterium]